MLIFNGSELPVWVPEQDKAVARKDHSQQRAPHAERDHAALVDYQGTLFLLLLFPFSARISWS